MNLKSRVIQLTGVSLVVAGGISVSSSIMTQLVSGDFTTLSAIKWSSIIAGAGIGLFFLVRHGVLANENLEEGERAYRRRWGKITTKRKTGVRKLLYPGKKHFYIKHMYDVVVQSIRPRSSPEEPDYDKPIKATFKGRNIWYLLIVDWRVIDRDEAIYKSLTKVYQVKRAEEGNDALENFVMNQVLKTIRRHLREFKADDDGLPIFTVDSDVADVPSALNDLLARLEDELGVCVDAIDTALLCFAPEEVLRGSLG